MLSSVAFMGMPQSGWNWIAGSSAADAKSYGKTQAYVSNLSAAEQSRAALLDRQRPLEMSAFSGQLTSLGMNARSQQIGRMGYVGPEADLASVQAQRSAVSGARQMQLDRTGVGGQVDRDDAQQRHLSLVQQEIGLRREEQTLMQQISDKALSTERDRLTSAHEYTQTLKQQLDTLARAEQSGMEGFAMSGPGRQGLILKAAQQLANDPTKLSRSQIEMLGPFRGMMGPEAQQQYQSAFAAKAPGFAQLGALLGFGGMQQGLLDQLSGAQGFERVIESQMENIKAAAEKSSEKMAKKVSELMIEMFDAMANKADVNLSQERERNSRRRRTMAAAAKFYGFD